MVAAGTETEALARKAEIDAHVDVVSERELLAQRIGADPEMLALDKLVPAAVLDAPRAARSR